MNYALIDNGIVTNLIWLHPMNANEFNAVPMNDLPVQIGDTYEDGKFYRNGEEVVASNGITEAQIATIKNQAVDEIREEVHHGTNTKAD